MRQTDLPVQKLIEICEAQIQGKGECHSCHGPVPVCFFINEIGSAALEENDRTAQKYLLGLLNHNNEEWRLISFCYLLQIPEGVLEAGDAAVLAEHKKKPENAPIIRDALNQFYNLDN